MDILKDVMMFCKKNWEEIIFLKINAWEKTIETFIGASDFCLNSSVGLLLFCWINKTKDWALVQTAALAINQGFNVRLG